MKARKKEFIDIVENNTNFLINKYGLSESMHTDTYFEYGLRVGMNSLEQYLKKHYTFKKKPKSRRKKWTPKKRTKKRFSVRK